MELDTLLRRSNATEEFKRDVIAFGRHEQAPRILTSRPSPRVKVLRLLSQLLNAEPALRIEAVEVEGWSGCSDYVGVIRVLADGEERAFRFVWCCQWRAQQEGWLDAFGLPDQIRAAREFGWRCFSEWHELPSGATATANVASASRVNGFVSTSFGH
jgi:hypothetical protein